LLKAYSLAENDELEAKEFLIKISDRLNEVISKMEDGYYKREYQTEKNVWENFYNSFIEKNKDNKSFLAEIHII
jgi:hypothetical protein